MGEHNAGAGIPAQTQLQLIWRRFKHHRLGIVGTVIVFALTFMALFADFLSPYHYAQQHRQYSYVPPMQVHFFSEDGFSFQPFVYALERQRDALTFKTGYTEDRSQKFPIRFFVAGDPYKFLGLFETNIRLFGLGTPPESPGQLFLWGTDQSGRDLLSRTLIGARVSMAVGPVSITLSLFLGMLFGGLSGLYGGIVDTLIQRLVEIMQSFPGLPLFLALAAILPKAWSPTMVFFGIVFIFSLIGWPGLARILRGQILTLREQEFILAARAMGTSNMRIIFRHLLPNTLTTLIVTASLGIPGAILGESSLSFLGLGIRDPMASWGLLLNDFLGSTISNLSFHPWLMIPGLFIILAVLAFNFMGDALRDAVDPFNIN